MYNPLNNFELNFYNLNDRFQTILHIEFTLNSDEIMYYITVNVIISTNDIL